MLYVRKVYQNPPPCSRLSQRFLACRKFGRTAHAWGVEIAEWVARIFLSSLHLVGSAFATEDVSQFSGAFTFTLSWLFATADVGASLIAADNLFFGRSDRFFLIFRHVQVFLGSPDRT